MPRYSLVTPVYNSAHLLPRLFSHLAQISEHYADFEVVLVDDGSSDDSLERCQRFAERNSMTVQVLTQENGGPGAARNKGLAAATGDYVWFMDCDDLINPAAFDAFDRILAKSPETQILIHGSISFSDAAALVFPGTAGSDPDFYAVSPQYVMLYHQYAPWTRICPRQFLLDQQFAFPPESYAEDVVAAVTMACRATHITKTDFPAYGYYSNPNGITHRSPDRNAASLMRSMQHLIALKSSCPQYAEALDWIVYSHTRYFLETLDPACQVYDALSALRDSVNLERNVFGKLIMDSQNNSWARLGNRLRDVRRSVRRVQARNRSRRG